MPYKLKFSAKNGKGLLNEIGLKFFYKLKWPKFGANNIFCNLN